MKLLETIISLYAPHACVGCDVEGPVLCPACLKGLPPPVGRCYRCHRAVPSGRTCVSCAGHGLAAVYPATRYVETAKAAVWQLKFERAQAAAGCMAELMAAACRDRLRAGSVIVPAPTAATRARSRGYDQAALLARAVARRTGLPCAAPLYRLGSQRQVGASRLQRQAQLQGAFRIRSARATRAIRGRHVLLVDDVITTGSTLEAAAQALLAAGALSVEAVIFAQA